MSDLLQTLGCEYIHFKEKTFSFSDEKLFMLRVLCFTSALICRYWCKRHKRCRTFLWNHKHNGWKSDILDYDFSLDDEAPHFKHWADAYLEQLRISFKSWITLEVTNSTYTKDKAVSPRPHKYKPVSSEGLCLIEQHKVKTTSLFFSCYRPTAGRRLAAWRGPWSSPRPLPQPPPPLPGHGELLLLVLLSTCIHWLLIGVHFRWNYPVTRSRQWVRF